MAARLSVTLAETEAAATPALAKLGAVLFNADFEDNKTDKWTAYDGSIGSRLGGAHRARARSVFARRRPEASERP